MGAVATAGLGLSRHRPRCPGAPGFESPDRAARWLRIDDVDSARRAPVSWTVALYDATQMQRQRPFEADTHVRRLTLDGHVQAAACTARSRAGTPALERRRPHAPEGVCCNGPMWARVGFWLRQWLSRRSRMSAARVASCMLPSATRCVREGAAAREHAPKRTLSRAPDESPHLRRAGRVAPCAEHERDDEIDARHVFETLAFEATPKVRRKENARGGLRSGHGGRCRELE